MNSELLLRRKEVQRIIGCECWFFGVSFNITFAIYKSDLKSLIVRKFDSAFNEIMSLRCYESVRAGPVCPGCEQLPCKNLAAMSIKIRKKQNS